MDSVLNVGFVGCGAIARKKHIPAAMQNPFLHIKGFYNRSFEAAADCQKLFGSSDSFAAHTPEELLEREDIDLVIVATPNNSHADYTIRALDAGKHVICEKPMASTAADAQRMLETAIRNEKFLHISYQNRYTDQAIYAKRLADKGKLGHIYYAKAYALRRRAVPTWGVGLKKEQGGGPLLDIGSHAIDLALWLSDCFRPEYAFGTAYDHLAKQGSEANHLGPWDPKAYEVEDLALGLVRMENGMTLSVEASYALNTAEEKEAAVDLFGTGAGLELRQDRGISLVEELSGRMVLCREDMQKTPRNLIPEYATLSPSQRELNAAVEKIRSGVMDNREAWQAVQVSRIVEGVYRSAQLGQGVPL